MNEEARQKLLRMLDEEAEATALKADRAVTLLINDFYFSSGRFSFLSAERILEDASVKVSDFYFRERDEYFKGDRKATFWVEQAWYDALNRHLAPFRLSLTDDNVWIRWSS